MFSGMRKRRRHSFNSRLIPVGFLISSPTVTPKVKKTKSKNATKMPRATLKKNKRPPVRIHGFDLSLFQPHLRASFVPGVGEKGIGFRKDKLTRKAAYRQKAAWGRFCTKVGFLIHIITPAIKYAKFSISRTGGPGCPPRRVATIHPTNQLTAGRRSMFRGFGPA